MTTLSLHVWFQAVRHRGLARCPRDGSLGMNLRPGFTLKAHFNPGLFTVSCIVFGFVRPRALIWAWRLAILQPSPPWSWGPTTTGHDNFPVASPPILGCFDLSVSCGIAPLLSAWLLPMGSLFPILFLLSWVLLLLQGFPLSLSWFFQLTVILSSFLPTRSAAFSLRTVTSHTPCLCCGCFLLSQCGGF